MINLNTTFNAFKSIICVNGAIPTQDFFARYTHLPIIAADGAANTLIQMGIYPCIIVGDLDSLHQDIIPAHIKIVHILDQNSTDLQKVLRIIAENKLFPCLIYGATGKETDHTLHNLMSIEEYSRRYKIVFHDSACTYKEKYGIFVSDRIYGTLTTGAKISIFAFTQSKITTAGLTWELNNQEISPTASSPRNSISSTAFEINVHSGRVLVLFDFAFALCA